MIIVYLSLLLVAAAVVGFFISAARTLKKMNGTLARIAKTGELLRSQTEKIAQEKNELTQNISTIQLDLFKKKKNVQKLSRQIQQTAELAQGNFYKVKMFMKREKA